MAKYKVGDKVIVKSEGVIAGSRPNGYVGIVTSLLDNVNENEVLYWLDEGNGVYGIDLIVNNKNNMNIIKKFKLLTLGEPQKSFVEKGVTDLEGTLTNDGKELFSQYLLNKFGNDFKSEVVDKIIVDEK